ncbi:MAG: Gfo/Idh/MocA family oxidoreductase [Actinomycetota bacterium]|nr:Gfo/Idh/MocA family oxidoreductase [Actinomycetota bacterium]MDQ2956918.1 Gfo/Idh/MocA family oxidoreductase [Actinomycetota bacterium]
MASLIPDDRPIRWGFLGAGGIAGKLAKDLARSPSNVLAAVAARSAERARTFADQNGAERSYDDYRRLVDDPAVDVVYIATTHPHHREQALLAVQAGKPILIEKPVCLNAADTSEVFQAAATAGVFAMEAMWMRTNPLIRTAQTLVAQGAIGELRSVSAEMTLGLPFDPAHRLYELANGGGALLDLGIYPLTFAWIFLGKPTDVRSTGKVGASGVDETVAMLCDYPGGATAQLLCSAPVPGPYRGLIQGTDGWIRFEGRFHRPTGLTVTTRQQQRVIDDPLDPELPGYLPQIEEVERCLRAGELTSPLVPPAESIAIMTVLDELRAGLGVRYPGE